MNDRRDAPKNFWGVLYRNSTKMRVENTSENYHFGKGESPPPGYGPTPCASMVQSYKLLLDRLHITYVIKFKACKNITTTETEQEQNDPFLHNGLFFDNEMVLLTSIPEPAAFCEYETPNDTIENVTFNS